MANFRFRIGFIIVTKTLFLHWGNEIVVGIVTPVGIRAPVQQNTSIYDLHFKLYKFYFLHVPKVLNMIPDKSVHAVLSG